MNKRVASSRADLRAFPEHVKKAAGTALRVAQLGGKHSAAKPLKGFGSAAVQEIATGYDGSTYRTVYTVQFEHAMYMLDAFQKKSKKGIKTPKSDLDRIKSRLKQAEKMYAEAYGQAKRK